MAVEVIGFVGNKTKDLFVSKEEKVMNKNKYYQQRVKKDNQKKILKSEKAIGAKV